MIYNDRVTLVKETVSNDGLEDDVATEQVGPLPCQRSALTNNEQMGIFGKYNLDSFKLHLQGIHQDFSEVIYKGKRRAVKGKKHHKNSTVIYL
nr:MAG TPA: head closure knob [Caudoviricetes sp.]